MFRFEKTEIETETEELLSNTNVPIQVKSHALVSPESYQQISVFRMLAATPGGRKTPGRYDVR